MTISKVVIILLNYIKWQDTVACIQSLSDCGYKNYEILIVDNASPNNSVLELAKRFPTIKICSTKKNCGYTGGINSGVLHALESKPEYILVLNPDTIVAPFFLDYLVEAMEECSDAAAASGTISVFPQTSKIWYAGGRLNAWRGLAIHNTRLPSDSNGEKTRFRPVSFVSGCMVLLRVSMLESIGMQDERFFMYLDDIEVPARILKKGFSLIYVPKAMIFHRVSKEAESVFKYYYTARNRLLLINTAFSWFPRFFARGYFLCVITLKMIFWRIVHPQFYRATRMGLEDYFAKRFGEGRGISEFTV